MSHDHHEHHGEKNIASAFFLNLLFVVVEFVGGLMTNSFAILSDALHDLGDTFALAISWYLERIAKKGKDAHFSLGYRRFSLLAALINSMILLIGAFIILSEVIPRLMHPHHSDAKGMFILALFGIAVNGLAAFRMRKGKSLNEQTVSLHLLEDVFGWIAVLLASILISLKDLHIIDPLLSLAITLYILVKVVKNLKQTLVIFLQGVPPEVKMDEIQKGILKIKGVKAMCETNIWSMDGVNNVLSTHIVVQDSVKGEKLFALKNKVKDLIHAHDIDHVTIEIERKKERDESDLIEKFDAIETKESFWKKIIPQTKFGKIVAIVVILLFLGTLFFVSPESEEHEHDDNAPGQVELHDE